MRILVTGGAGFLGSHLVDLLVAQGHDVTVIDNLSGDSTANLRSDVRFVKGDIRGPLDERFGQVRPEAVVHLAAQVSVPHSVADPVTDLTVNVNGTINVMQAAARAGARKLVAISSAAVYGIPQALPLTEESPTVALSPYGLSKLTGEHYIRMLAGQWDLAYTILRPANIYGPRQQTEGDGAVIPAFLGRFLSGMDPVIQGDGSHTRDFLYAADMARAIALALRAADGLTLNVSSGTATTINELWRNLADLTGWRRAPVYGPPRAGDITHSVMANAQAQQHLGWVPQVSLAEGLAETVIWARRGAAAAGRDNYQFRVAYVDGKGVSVCGVPVLDVLRLLNSGQSPEQVVASCPELDIRDVLGIQRANQEVARLATQLCAEDPRFAKQVQDLLARERRDPSGHQG